MFTISLPALFAALYLIATVLVLLGMREHTDAVRRVRLMKMGGVLFGLTTIVLGFSWYATRPQMGLLGYVQMRLEDLGVLTMLSSAGGATIGYAVRMD